MAKINSIKALRDNLIEAQEKDLSFKSASDGMGFKEESNAMDHLLRSRNRDISCLNKLIRENEVKKFAEVTAPPKSLYYIDERGQSFIDEAYAKKREKKAFWIGVGATALIGGILLACNKKKGGEK